MHVSQVCLALTVALTVALAVALPGTARAQTGRPPPEHLYVLNFNAWGELQSPGERHLAIEQLSRDRSIERIVIFSYGWGHDAESAHAFYRSITSEIDRNLPPEHVRPPVAVIGIGWDSAQTGFRKLFNSIIPLPGLANTLAWPLDTLLFPISFWSKASQADRIGYGGLRTALNEIFSVYEDGDRHHPEVYLIGHSFGTRILSGLMKPSLGAVDVSSNPFRSAEHVRGALLYQPALVGANLDHDATYPIMVTMSEHDHAVGALYPVANVPLNAFGFTIFEALVQRLLLAPVQRGVEATRSTVTTVVTAPLPTGSKAEVDDAPDESQPSMVAHAVQKTRRTAGEVLALPLNLVFTLIALPLDYAYIQTTGLVTGPVDHVMDTLAQLPVIEVPVDGLGRLVGKEVPWGRRSKGLLMLGSIHEGMGRLSPPLALYPDPTVYTPDELDALEQVPVGIFVVDASDRISRGSYGVDLAAPLADYTIGWVDPLGAHSDFTNPKALALAAWMTSGARIRLAERPEPQASAEPQASE